MIDDRSRITIRPAIPDDADAIVMMVRALSAHEGQGPPRFTAEQFRRHAFGPDAVYSTFVAEVDGERIGMVAFHGGFSSQIGEAGLHVVDLYVAGPWRRRGVGRRLMGAVGREARGRGCQWIAWTVRRDNPLALEFYQGIGGRVDPDVTMYLRGPTLDRLLDLTAGSSEAT
jgi:GNAT superfamily N-acetyltransferase